MRNLVDQSQRSALLSAAHLNPCAVARRNTRRRAERRGERGQAGTRSGECQHADGVGGVCAAAVCCSVAPTSAGRARVDVRTYRTVRTGLHGDCHDGCRQRARCSRDKGGESGAAAVSGWPVGGEASDLARFPAACTAVATRGGGPRWAGWVAAGSQQVERASDSKAGGARRPHVRRYKHQAQDESILGARDTGELVWAITVLASGRQAHQTN